MGIEARRNINESDSNDDTYDDVEVSDKKDNNNLSDEILKLEELNKKGILTDEEYEKAKKKIIGLGRFNFLFYKSRYIFIFIDNFFFLPFGLKNYH